MAGLGHVGLLNDLADLGLKAHVEHAIGLVEHEKVDVREGNATALHQVDKTTGRGDEESAAAAVFFFLNCFKTFKVVTK